MSSVSHSEQLQAGAKVLSQIRLKVDDHDDGGCKGEGQAKGILMSFADIERLGFDEGDVVYPSKGIKLHAGGQYGLLRVMCDECGNEHELDDREAAEEAQRLAQEYVEGDAVRHEEKQRERELVPT